MKLIYDFKSLEFTKNFKDFNQSEILSHTFIHSPSNAISATRLFENSASSF